MTNKATRNPNKYVGYEENVKPEPSKDCSTPGTEVVPGDCSTNGAESDVSVEGDDMAWSTEGEDVTETPTGPVDTAGKGFEAAEETGSPFFTGPLDDTLIKVAGEEPEVAEETSAGPFKPAVENFGDSLFAVALREVPVLRPEDLIGTDIAAVSVNGHMVVYEVTTGIHPCVPHEVTVSTTVDVVTSTVVEVLKNPGLLGISTITE